MGDNLNKKRPRDYKRINVHEDYELSYWTKALGASKQKLKEAVSKVGTSAEAVKKYFNKT